MALFLTNRQFLTSGDSAYTLIAPPVPFSPVTWFSSKIEFLIVTGELCVQIPPAASSMAVLALMTQSFISVAAVASTKYIAAALEAVLLIKKLF